jgi:predicted lysophospholipase L1 biosynthesis ABC-type transport system permease subunit
LRSLGLRHSDSRRLLVAELAGPVVVGAVGGLVIGLGAAFVTFDALSLELVTGQSSSPAPTFPWWTAAPVAVVIATITAVGLREAAWTRRTPLSSLMSRAGR